MTSNNSAPNCSRPMCLATFNFCHPVMVDEQSRNLLYLPPPKLNIPRMEVSCHSLHSSVSGRSSSSNTILRSHMCSIKPRIAIRLWKQLSLAMYRQHNKALHHQQLAPLPKLRHHRIPFNSKNHRLLKLVVLLAPIARVQPVRAFGDLCLSTRERASLVSFRDNLSMYELCKQMDAVAISTDNSLHAEVRQYRR
jgi:hypothetical protein